MAPAVGLAHFAKLNLSGIRLVEEVSRRNNTCNTTCITRMAARRLLRCQTFGVSIKSLLCLCLTLGVYEFDEPDGTSGQRQIYMRLREP